MNNFQRYALSTITLLLAAPAVVLADGTAAFGVTGVERVNLRAGGTEPPAMDGDGCCQSDISDDGNIAVFETEQRLVATDVDLGVDIYVRNRQADTIVRVSQPPMNATPSGDSFFPRISGDGRYVAFWSFADNLVSEDTNGALPDVFIYDVMTGSLERVEPDAAGPGQTSTGPAISGNGRYIASGHTTSRATQGVANYLARHDNQATGLTVFENAYGVESAHVANDGCVYFTSTASLVAGDVNQSRDIYAIGCPGTNPGAADLPVLITVGLNGGATDNDSRGVHGTPDGRYLTFFSSASNLVASDTNSAHDVFVYDVEQATFSRASVSSSGQQSGSDSYNPNISSDGRFVSWHSSASDLGSEPDLNNAADIFMHNRVTGETRLVSRQPGAESNGNSNLPAINADGRSVLYFSAATNLVANDNNTRRDYFVSTVRVPASNPAYGDLNGDDKGDLVWRNPATGANWISLLDGTAVQQTLQLQSAPGEWQIQGRGDFNGDEKADLHWRNTSSGQNSIWLMDGAQIASNRLTQWVGDQDWSVAVVGDFDGDGKDDLFWRNAATGQNAVWLLDGLNLRTAVLLNTIPLSWSVMGAGDFDADGKHDLMWRDTAGANAIWLLDGTSVKSSSLLTPVSTPWTVQGVADMDADGCADILWRNPSTGQNVVWLMDTFDRRESLSLSSVAAPDWNMEVLSDFDGDERADIAWRSNFSGQWIVWLMDGAVRVDTGPVRAASPLYNLVR